MSEERKIVSEEEKRNILLGQPRQEAPKEEVKEEIKEEIKDETKETKTDVKDETKTEVSEFDYSFFKTKFEREIESEDALKSLFEKADKYEETNKSFGELSQKLDEYKNIADKFDPMKNFLNEDEYKRQQLLIRDGDKLGEDAIKALSVLTPARVKELSDVDALKTQLMIDKGITSKEAEIFLSSKYGVDGFSADDIDDSVKTVMKVDAIDARRNVEKLYEGIDVPTKTDYEAAREQLKDSWKEPIPELVKGIDKIQIAEGLDFIVTDDMKEGLAENALSFVMSKQMKPSEEVGASIVGQLKDSIILNNMDKVVKSIRADLAEEFKAETRKTIHNDKPLDDSTRSEHTVEDNDAKMNRIM